MHFSILIVAICIELLFAQGVTSVKYYRTEEDFIRDNPMMATERLRDPYIRVLFNEKNRMVSKAWIDTLGNMIQEEIYDYDSAGNIEKRSVRNKDGKVEKLYVYSDDEKMSRIFINYAFPQRNPEEFKDRITVYDFNSEGEIEGYYFYAVDNTEFGSILFDYFDSGLVKEERWLKLPGRRTVRLFQYNFDPISRFYELTEYDSTGAKVSHVGLVLTEEMSSMIGKSESLIGEKDRDHLLQPPASGNILEESSMIIEDIQKKRAQGWVPEEELGAEFWESIQKTHDIIYLKNGQVLEVDLFQISDEYVRFQFIGEEEILTIHLDSVQEIERRDGKIVYPILY